MTFILSKQAELFNSKADFQRTYLPTLRRWADKLPQKPWVYRPEIERTLIRPKDSAWQHETHVQCDTPWLAQYIVIDCDYEYSPFDSRFVTVTPTFWTFNPQTFHTCLFFELAQPVRIDQGDKQKQKVQYWFENLSERLRLYFDGDEAFSGLTPRNPLHRDICVKVTNFAKPRTLAELQKVLDRANAPHPEKIKPHQLHTPNSDPDSWNRELFDRARTWAYGAVEHYSDRDTLWADVRQYIENQADARTWLAVNTADIKSISKSVATFCINNRAQLAGAFEQKNRGVLGFGATRHGHNFDMPYLPPEEVKRRQQAGAEYTNRLRSLDVESRIKTSIAYLETIGKKVSQSTVASHSKVGIATVKRYWRNVR